MTNGAAAMKDTSLNPAVEHAKWSWMRWVAPCLPPLLLASLVGPACTLSGAGEARGAWGKGADGDAPLRPFVSRESLVRELATEGITVSLEDLHAGNNTTVTYAATVQAIGDISEQARRQNAARLKRLGASMLYFASQRGFGDPSDVYDFKNASLMGSSARAVDRIFVALREQREALSRDAVQKEKLLGLLRMHGPDATELPELPRDKYLLLGLSLLGRGQHVAQPVSVSGYPSRWLPDSFRMPLAAGVSVSTRPKTYHVRTFLLLATLIQRGIEHHSPGRDCLR